ncbi:MAG TPA: GGDEF domain-containing protein [Gemmatimonadales bacterium]|nr:GGDEF domain-containing protein [Gemmatimonadales bacterium]
MAQALSELLAALAGAAVGWFAARRRTAGTGPGLAPGLIVSDASLDWLQSAIGAHAVWALAPPVESAPAERFVAGEPSLAGAELAALEHRIAEAQRDARPSVERLDAGTFVLRARNGAVSAALLPNPTAAGTLDRAAQELERLLDALERRPRLTAMARAEQNPGHLESLASVAHRLAFELEALTGGDVIVAMALPPGVTVVGLGGAADARLEGAVAAAETPLARLVHEGPDLLQTDEPPLGPRIADRRRQERPAVLLAVDQGGQRLGGVVIWPRGGELPPSALVRVQDAIRRAVPQLSRAREAFELRTAAARDPLTGLANRRQLQVSMQDPRVGRAGLVVLDIDHFKRLNDTLGHPAGDDALLHVAGILRRETRASDVPARIGGEEFAIWLPGATLEAAGRLAERVRRVLEQSYWTWQGAPWTLTASFGVAHWGETTQQLDQLVQQADDALYAAKQAGRNRVAQAG